MVTNNKVVGYPADKNGNELVPVNFLQGLPSLQSGLGYTVLCILGQIRLATIT